MNCQAEQQSLDEAIETYIASHRTKQSAILTKEAVTAIRAIVPTCQRLNDEIAALVVAAAIRAGVPVFFSDHVTTSAFISELVQAANGIDRLTKQECSRLLDRAAMTLADLREIAQFPPAPANQEGGSVKELREMARQISLFSDAEIAATMKSAVALIAIAQARAKGKVH